MADFRELRLGEVRRIPGSVTEPIQERHRPLTYLADNASARKPLGEAEDPPPLAQHVGGHPLLDTNLLRIWLCPDPMAHGNSQALIHLLGTSVNRGLEGLGAPPKLPLSQPAPASRQGVSVGVVLVA